jgi:hypothetical protein
MMGINIPMNMKGVEYITEKAGVVRSEYYNKNGKLGGYTLLSKIDQLSFWLFSVQEFPVPILRNL